MQLTEPIWKEEKRVAHVLNIHCCRNIQETNFFKSHSNSSSQLENMFKTDEFRGLRRPVKTLRKRPRVQQTRCGHGSNKMKKRCAAVKEPISSGSSFSYRVDARGKRSQTSATYFHHQNKNTKS